MTDEQIELLKKALNLFQFIVDDNYKNYDFNIRNDYWIMLKKLSEIIGVDVTE